MSFNPSFYQEFSSPFREISNIGRTLSPLWSTSRFIGNALKPLMQVAERISQLPDEIGLAMRRLAAFGWYVDPEMALTAPQVFANRLEEKGEDNSVAEHFRGRLNDIELAVVERYPHRRTVLQEAFSAHRESRYHLSIPVFLAQADGIWWDKFSTNLFRRNQRDSTASAHLSDLEDSFAETTFSLFLESILLWQSEIERTSSFCALNRHQIMHGEVVEYGNEITSLKCISFLNFLCWALNLEMEEEGLDS